jgi:hypothetical protein
MSSTRTRLYLRIAERLSGLAPGLPGKAGETLIRAAEASEDEAKGNWFPIASAPQDGTEILLFSPAEGQAVGKWHPEFVAWLVIVNGQFVYIDPDDSEPLHLKSPSHWTYLLPPPK